MHPGVNAPVTKTCHLDVLPNAGNLNFKFPVLRFPRHVESHETHDFVKMLCILDLVKLACDLRVGQLGKGNWERVVPLRVVPY